MTMNIRNLDPELHKAFKVIATQEGTNITQLIIRLMTEYVEKKAKR